mmetsp:Transcript_6543/g.26261  ORF Transcript_6543/g.26261 Transcript_6543/m.26261 type:complete len:293 (-) Transcript_6543:3826-4704(-)
MNSVRIGVDVAGIGRPLSTRAHRRCNSFQKAMCNTCDNRVEIHSTSEVLRDSGRVALKKSIGLCRVADGLSGANFKVHEFFSHLDDACKMGRCLLVGSALVSTQKLLSENARLFPEGTLLICDTQSNGKGRGNNLWTSNEGCLMFSFTCNFRDGRTLPCVQYIASLALVEAVKEYTAHVQGRVGEKEVLPGLKIKWPNDLYYGNQKIGGILCNSAYSDGAFCTTIGIGFNLHNKEPTLCLADVLEQHAAQSMKREVLVATFLGHFTRLNLTFSEAGFKSIRVRKCCVTLTRS